MKDKNSSAVELGKRSAESRFKGMNKAERAEAMKKVWQKSVEVRKSVHLTKE